jgi:hypothetical protein
MVRRGTQGRRSADEGVLEEAEGGEEEVAALAQGPGSNRITHLA